MLLEFDQVTYRYPGSQQPALQGLSVQIPAGRRCALIGQNGCGKTTLFRLANGLYRPTQGTVRWQGQPLRYHRRALNQLRQQVGLVFQDPEQQLVATTVEEDLSYGLCNLGLSDAEIAERVQQTLHRFDLLDLADAPVNHLSLGQKRRVAIADVMILQPKLLLLDEPTAYLDPRHTRELIGRLEHIHACGTTILLASHNLDFVYRWADWVLVMHQGRLILSGSPQTVFAQREVLDRLQLGIPLAIDLVEQIQAMIICHQPVQTLTLEQLQAQILSQIRARKY
ncbi:MAG: ABC transporter ATP-binding protein [Leptolyngbya sp. SIO1E4]|nr:ABC transporter ATP-binding protein [Leptolyngbya sp. SIO1E4]